jgi:hypothetical protein
MTCGAFTPEGQFVEVPEVNIGRLEAAWREAMFALYLVGCMKLTRWPTPSAAVG